MGKALFYARAAWRSALVWCAPGVRGPRDRLYAAEKRNLWKGTVELPGVLAGAVRSQALAARVGEMEAYLAAMLPLARFPFSRRAYLELSYLSTSPGIGIGVANYCRDVERAFLGHLERSGCPADLLDLCRALCEPFGSNMIEVRAEFFAEEATRYTIFPGRWLDTPRHPRAYDAAFRRFPREFAGARTLMESLAPDFFFPYVGLSFAFDGRREFKIYPTRFDREISHFAPGARGRALLERMGVPAHEIERVREFHERVRPRLAEGFVQVGAAVDERGEPTRASVILGHAPLAIYQAALDAIGLGEGARPALDTFARELRVDAADSVSIRVKPEGVSPRVKVYRMDSYGWPWGKTLRETLGEKTPEAARTGT
ncbi:MAG: hypothetical protein HY720_12115 [Planctomycetes bacterium]|nr:hypothetical protein [Planctomycetota bacterium]